MLLLRFVRGKRSSNEWCICAFIASSHRPIFIYLLCSDEVQLLSIAYRLIPYRNRILFDSTHTHSATASDAVIFVVAISIQTIDFMLCKHRQKWFSSWSRGFFLFVCQKLNILYMILYRLVLLCCVWIQTKSKKGERRPFRWWTNTNISSKFVFQSNC